MPTAVLTECIVSKSKLPWKPSNAVKTITKKKDWALSRPADAIKTKKILQNQRNQQGCSGNDMFDEPLKHVKYHINDS